MNKEETPSMVPPSGSITSPSTETFDHLADYNLIGGLTMP
jgi:hypothetical protein